MELTNSQIIDSVIFGDGYSTAESKKIFSEQSKIERWLFVEIALSKVQGKLGIIPIEAAREISSLSFSDLDIDYIKRGIEETGHSLIPLLKACQKNVSKASGEYIHYGATTQDIQDTAQSLELKEVYAILERDLKNIIKIITELAQKYKDQLIVGRTHAKHALPMTLGLKFSVWVDEIIRHYERLISSKPRVLKSQLFGGVGTMASLGDDAQTLLDMFSEELGLIVSNSSWHSSRDGYVEFMSLLALISGSLGKFANEVIQLSKDEINEINEGYSSGHIGSSTMPHKQNPETAERIVTLSKLVKGHASLSFDELICEHERDYRNIRLEWVTLNDTCQYVCCALKMSIDLLSNIRINENNIAKNIELSSVWLCTEQLMFAIGEKIGKQTAHEIICEACKLSEKREHPLVDILLTYPMIASNFSIEEINRLIEPASKLGHCHRIVEHVSDLASHILKNQHINNR